MSAKSVICLLLLAGALSARAQAECITPTPSPIPDGATATEAEMIAAMKAFKQFDAQASIYLKCIEEQTAQSVSRHLSDRAGLKEKQAEAHNAMVDELQAAAGKFNKQVRIYKDRAKTAKN